MSDRIKDVNKAIQEGTGLVLVQDEFKPYSVLFQKQDPLGGDSARDLLEWDPEAGFVPLFDHSDDLPELLDLIEALEFIRGYRGEAIFLLDCHRVDFSQGESRLRKVLRQLHMKLSQDSAVTAVLLCAAPISKSLAKRVTWFGDEPAAESTAPRAARSGDEYREMRDLTKFDTEAWEVKLDSMSFQEAEAIVDAGAYKDSLERINELRANLRGIFARKEQIVDAVCAAAVAQIPTVLIGPPGTAKSNLIRCFCEGLGLTASTATNGARTSRRYFEYLLTRYTTPEEIFGPIHVQDLIDKQIYRRVTEGYLPEAQVAFLDEIFKASSAILNTLLTLLNERVFYNAGEAVRVPLMMVFAASNEAPSDEGLQALYDRFPLRLNCQSVEDEHVDALLTSSWQQAFDRQFGTHSAVRKCCCTNDFRVLRHVMRVKFGGRTPHERGTSVVKFGSEFLRFFRSLRADFGISDRTASQLLAYCRAQALLEERSELTIAELDVFRHVVWDESGTGELDRLITNMKRGVRI